MRLHLSAPDRGPASRHLVAVSSAIALASHTLSAVLLAVTLSASGAGQVSVTNGTGRVTVSVVSPYGDGIDEATVTLELIDATGAEIRQWAATTDAGGTTVFEGLSTGIYRVVAERQGYTARAAVPPHAPEENNRIAIGEVPVNLEIELVLRPAGRVAGRILNPDGTPASGAGVAAAIRTDPESPLITIARTTAARDGLYDIPGLPAGLYLVIAQPPSRDSIDTTPGPAAIHPGVPVAEPGTPIRIFEGAATEGIDVWLLPAPQRFTVSGRVFDLRGGPVRNIAIEHADVQGVRSGVWIVSDPDGYFTIEGVPPGPFIMLARAESSTGPVAGLASTELTVGAVEDVRLVVDVPGSIEGRVVFEGAVPRLESRLLVSLEHTLIRVSLLHPRDEAEVQDDGRFRIPHALGHYRFRVGGLPEGWAVQRVLRNGRLVEDGRLTVSNRDRVHGIELVVGPGTSSDR